MAMTPEKKVKDDGTLLFRDGAGFSECMYQSDVLNLITNAPAIAQGEPVVIDSIAAGIINGKRQTLPMGATYYTAPPQPQTVKDALEKAAMVVQAKIGHYYPTPLTDAVAEIRTLIEKE